VGVDAQLFYGVNNKCWMKGCFDVVVVFSGYIVTTASWMFLFASFAGL
jgi:hypothetical protein